MNVKIIQCSFPDIDVARQIGTFLIEKQYAACVKLIKEVESTYRWQNKLCSDSEILMLAKTSADRADKVVAEVTKRHPYDIPDVLVIDVVGGNKDYDNWVLDSISRT